LQLDAAEAYRKMALYKAILMNRISATPAKRWPA
jgi:hypothetical protein